MAKLWFWPLKGNQDDGSARKIRHVMQVKAGRGGFVVPVGSLKISSTRAELKDAQDVATALTSWAENFHKTSDEL